MKNPTNNAIIVTTIQGERGSAGYAGPAGQACYTGIGDPSTLSLTLPDYSADPASTVRGSEVLYYQDTSSGKVWTHNYYNGVPVPAGWVLTTASVRGDQGDPGSTATNKVDINLMTGTTPSLYSDYNTPLVNNIPTPLLIGSFNFPGTKVGTFLGEVKVLGSISEGTIAVVSITDGVSQVAAGTIEGSIMTINSLTIDSILPYTNTILQIFVTVISTTGNPADLNLSYLSIR